jgi:hypothetical protein
VCAPWPRNLGLYYEVVVGEPPDEAGVLEAVDGVVHVGVLAKGLVVTRPQAELERYGDDADRDRSGGRGQASAQVPGDQHCSWAEDRAVDDLEVGVESANDGVLVHRSGVSRSASGGAPTAPLGEGGLQISWRGGVGASGGWSPPDLFSAPPVLRAVRCGCALLARCHTNGRRGHRSKGSARSRGTAARGGDI